MLKWAHIFKVTDQQWEKIDKSGKKLWFGNDK